MSKSEFLRSSAVVRLAGVGMLAGALGACSTDVARFSENPFGNPFKGGASQQLDRTATGSVSRSASAAGEKATSTARSVGSVTSQPLSAPNVTGSIPSRTSLTQSASSAVSAPSAVALAQASSASGRSVAGWSATGGTPVVMATGENVNTLASRYGVPASAILSANGLSSASQLTPGSRVTIPVYNAAGSAAQGASSAAPRVSAPSRAAVAAPEPQPLESLPEARNAVITPRPPAPVQAPAVPRPSMSERAVPVRPPAPVQAASPKPVANARPAQVAAAQPPMREAETTRAAPQPVAAPRTVSSASADAAREKARAQAEAARTRADAVRQQSAASTRADTELKARSAAEAKARADAEKARLAELRAQTDTDRARTAELRKTAEAERTKAAEAKRKAEAEMKLQAAAKTKADRELKAAQAAARPAATVAAPAVVAAVPRAQVDPGPTASIPKDEAKPAVAAAPAAEFRWPARGRVINGFSGKGGNEGINIAVPEGTPVKSAGDGVVAYSGNELKGYGNLVLIRHDNGYVSAYAHNGDINVKRGERVNRGQVIAKSGQTGNVASPQLHFEIRKGSNPVDPMPYLSQ